MKLFSFSFLALLVAIGFSSCLKQKYTAPPEDAALTWDTVLPTNTTLKFITQSCLALNSSVGSRQMGDTTISGVVVGVDRTGNLYKMIIIEDTLGGAIELYVDKSYLYNDFPVGRKVYVKLKGPIGVTISRATPVEDLSLKLSGIVSE